MTCMPGLDTAFSCGMIPATWVAGLAVAVGQRSTSGTRL